MTRHSQSFSDRLGAATDESVLLLRERTAVHVEGQAGSGKSAVAIELATRAARTMPTTLVVSEAAQVERIRTRGGLRDTAGAAEPHVTDWSNCDHQQTRGLVVYDDAQWYDPPPRDEHPSTLAVLYTSNPGYRFTRWVASARVVTLDSQPRFAVAHSTVGVLRRAGILTPSPKIPPRLDPDAEKWADVVLRAVREESMSLIFSPGCHIEVLVENASRAIGALRRATEALPELPEPLAGQPPVVVIDALELGSSPAADLMPSRILTWRETIGGEWPITIVPATNETLADQEIAEVALTRHCYSCLILTPDSPTAPVGQILTGDGRACLW